MNPDSKSSAGTDSNSAASWPHTLGIARQAKFEETRWTLVNQAQLGGQATVAKAMMQLCQLYWYPLYAYVRRSGQSRENAEDLTQGFFARLLEKDLLASACQEKGRLRSYLLTALKRYMINEWKRASAEKRGGGLEAVPIDLDQGEDRYEHEPIRLDPLQPPANRDSEAAGPERKLLLWGWSSGSVDISARVRVSLNLLVVRRLGF